MKRNSDPKKKHTNKKKTNKNQQNNPDAKSILQFLKPKNSENSEISITEDENKSFKSASNSLNLTFDNKNPKRQFNFNFKSTENSQIPFGFKNKETNEDYKRKIIINEFFIEEFLKNLSPCIKEIEKNLKNFDDKKNLKIFSKKNFGDFRRNIDLFVIKFFLQIEEIFIFVPKFLSNEKLEDLKEIETEKHLFKLFEGFDKMDNYMNYQPITGKEVINYLTKKNFSTKKNFFLFISLISNR